MNQQNKKLIDKYWFGIYDSQGSIQDSIKIKL